MTTLTGKDADDLLESLERTASPEEMARRVAAARARLRRLGLADSHDVAEALDVIAALVHGIAESLDNGDELARDRAVLRARDILRKHGRPLGDQAITSCR